MTLIPLRFPGSDVWSRLGLTLEAELHPGHQSRVFRAASRVGPLIVKLTDGRRGDEAHGQRVEILARLSEVNQDVVGPVQLGSDLVSQVGDWLIVCYPYAEGSMPDIQSYGDVAMMATTLAALHDSLASITDIDVPPVAALRGADEVHLASGQLIHGDFADANLLATTAGLRIIDFDDCGYGSIQFEVGNSLYMVLFDAWLTNDPDRYGRFRAWFVDSYQASASLNLDELNLNKAIQVRIDALRRWLDTPADAPIGIRTASAEWRQRLRSFLDAAVQ